MIICCGSSNSVGFWNVSLVNHLNLTISPFCNSDQIAIVPNTVVVVMWCFDGHIALVSLSFLWQLFYTWANIILSLGCMLLMVECPKRSLWELRQNSLPAKELSWNQSPYYCMSYQVYLENTEYSGHFYLCYLLQDADYYFLKLFRS